MHDYHFAHLRLRSALELPELCKVTPGSPPTTGEVRITVDNVGLDPNFKAAHTDERSSFAMARDPESGVIHVRHEDAVDFIVSADLNNVVIRPNRKIASSTVRHYLLDQMLPRILEERGHFILHASGVESPDGGVLFLGDSGSGKSSLAAHFEMTGSRLLGDDCFTIEDRDNTIVAQSTYPSLRLLPDSITNRYGREQVSLSVVAEDRKKQRVDQSLVTPPAPGNIAGLYIIDLTTDHHGPPEVHQVATRNALLYLLKNSFRLDLGSESAQRSMAFAEIILRRIPLFELRYERRYKQLAKVQDLVGAQLKTLA